MHLILLEIIKFHLQLYKNFAGGITTEKLISKDRKEKSDFLIILKQI